MTMNSKTILIGGLVAAGLITAGVMLGGDSQPTTEVQSTGLLFPKFDENSAQEVEVHYADGSYLLDREGEHWGLVSKGGYPIDIGKLRTMLLAIGNAEIVDQKTADPTRHAQLGLTDEAEVGDLDWRRLEIRGANGTTLADLILGKRADNGRASQVFARRAGENQTWLVSVNGLALPPIDADWIDKQILKIGRDRVRAARVTHPDGEVVTVSKRDAKDEHYVFHELGGRKLRYVSAPDGLGAALEYLKLDDVSRADAMDFGDSVPTITSLWTWDGIRLDVRVYAVDDTHWATLVAVADPEGVPLLPATGEEASADDAAAEASITPASRQADIDTLNAKLSPWVFQLPTYNASSLTKRATDYIEAAPKPKTDDEVDVTSDFSSPGADVAPPENATPQPDDEDQSTTEHDAEDAPDDQVVDDGSTSDAAAEETDGEEDD